MSNEEKLFLTTDGYEYLESYLTKLYGERGAFKHNLERYANSEEFRGKTHVVNSIDDIQEVSFEQIVAQVEREVYFQSRAHDLCQWYDNLAAKDELNADTVYDAAGVMGLAPGRDIWTNTLFTDRALDAIHESSSGIPRMINRVCEKSLMYAFQQGKRLIDEHIVFYVVEHEMLENSIPHGERSR